MSIIPFSYYIKNVIIKKKWSFFEHIYLGILNTLLACDCSIPGSLDATGISCTDPVTCPCNDSGNCTCAANYLGDKCNMCASGYFDSNGNLTDSIVNCTGTIMNSVILCYF